MAFLGTSLIDNCDFGMKALDFDTFVGLPDGSSRLAKVPFQESSYIFEADGETLKFSKHVN